MSDEVRDEIELHLIDTRVLVEEAKKIRQAEELVKRSKKAKRELTAGVPPISGAAISPPGALPKGFFTSEEQTRRGAIAGARTESEFTKLLKRQHDTEKQLKNLQVAQQNFEKKLVGDLRSLGSLLINPSAIPNIILQKIGKFGIIGSLIAGAIATALDMATEQFQRGFVFSTKLKAPQQAFSLNDVEEQNAYRSGTKYITSDLRILQQAPASSNTGSLKFEHLRYVMDTLGSP